MNKTVLAVALSAAFLAVPAGAEPYVGIGIGDAKTDVSKTSWKLYGGFQFSPTWGLEGAYTDLGRYRGSAVESRSLAATGTLPFAERWSLLGKLGATSNRTHFGSASNHTDALIGLGVGYSMSKSMGVRLEYEDFGKLASDNGGSNSRARNWGLSMKYGF